MKDCYGIEMVILKKKKNSVANNISYGFALELYYGINMEFVL